MAQNGLKWPPKATLSTLGSYSGSLHRIWDHWGLFWCKKEEKLAQKWAQFGPVQELASGVLEARGINRHNFFDYFPPLGTHTKWFMQKKSLARTIKIPRGFTHFECTTVGWVGKERSVSKCACEIHSWAIHLITNWLRYHPVNTNQTRIQQRQAPKFVM